jgi:site-specific DNA-methyltransferase (adenine-specific)
MLMTRLKDYNFKFKDYSVNTTGLKIFNTDCITGARRFIPDGSVPLMICDPPFGIHESTFDRHYRRNAENVIEGYVEAPADYEQWSYEWVKEAKRILKPNGSMYIISGWTRLREVLNAIDANDLYLINNLIWKYPFGVNATRKFVTSHYHILYVKKTESAKVTFNTFCRFGPDDRDEHGRCLRYLDMEDVWTIKRDYIRNEPINQNKLPDALIEKMIQYSSNPGDTVCDFFLGNFTTAKVALRLGRVPMGFEINEHAFRNGMQNLYPLKCA